jgi:hypothetical protein
MALSMLLMVSNKHKPATVRMILKIFM